MVNRLSTGIESMAGAAYRIRALATKYDMTWIFLHHYVIADSFETATNNSDIKLL